MVVLGRMNRSVSSYSCTRGSNKNSLCASSIGPYLLSRDLNYRPLFYRWFMKYMYKDYDIGAHTLGTMLEIIYILRDLLCTYYTTTLPRVLVHEVMQDFHHQPYRIYFGHAVAGARGPASRNTGEAKLAPSWQRAAFV